MSCVWLAYAKRLCFTLAYNEQFWTCPKQISCFLRINKHRRMAAYSERSRRMTNIPQHSSHTALLNFVFYLDKHWLKTTDVSLSDLFWSAKRLIRNFNKCSSSYDCMKQCNGLLLNLSIKQQGFEIKLTHCHLVIWTNS